MKKTALICLPALAFILLGFAILALCGQQRFVRVTADAEVMAPPDRVTITAGTQYKTTHLQQDSKMLQQNIEKALNFCKTQGIKDKNIQIQNVSIMPSYYNLEGKRTQTPTYTLSQSFSVTLEDLSQYETILYGLLDNGINQVQDVRFYSSQIQEFRDQARNLAIRNAKEKAVLLAKSSGTTVGKILTITEERPAGFGSVSNMSQNAYINGANGAAPAGVIPVRAEVTVQFELK